MLLITLGLIESKSRTTPPCRSIQNQSSTRTLAREISNKNILLTKEFGPDPEKHLGLVVVHVCKSKWAIHKLRRCQRGHTSLNCHWYVYLGAENSATCHNCHHLGWAECLCPLLSVSCHLGFTHYRDLGKPPKFIQIAADFAVGVKLISLTSENTH